MRVGRIVQLLLQLLLLLERSSVSSKRGWRTQITSPWNIKRAVPAKKSHERSRLNSLPENSSGQLNDNLKALHEEECILILNGRYVICPTLGSEFCKQLDCFIAVTRLKCSSDSRENNNGERLNENMANFLRKTQNKLQSLLRGIDNLFKNDEERKEIKMEHEFSTFLENFGIKKNYRKRHIKRHVSHYYSSPDHWTYQFENFVIYDFNTSVVLVRWPAIPSEYERDIYNLFLNNNSQRHYKKRRRNHHREHIHDYVDEKSGSEEYKDFTKEIDDESAGRVGSVNNVPTRPTDPPLSHMLQHVYPPWPMNKTVKRYRKL